MKRIKIVYHQKRMRGKEDSFWYCGDIAVLTYKGREVTLVAAGEICIRNKDNEYVFDTKARGPGFPELKNHEPQNDKDLAKLEKLGYHWENNNWFEVFFTTDITNGVHHQDSILGDVAYYYKEGIELAKHYLKDNKFWERIEEERSKAKELK